MAGIMSSTLQKAQHVIMGSTGGDKLNDLKQETKDMSDKGRLTTDYGVKQMTADDWLRVVNKDKTGPMLLEDPFARERVRLSAPFPPPVLGSNLTDLV